MDLRILDLDGSVARQDGLVGRYRPERVDLSEWGPRIRLACRHGNLGRFERALAERLGPEAGGGPVVTLYGSGDFHHVSLALLRRLTTPFNLLVLDNHPDWMRGIPFLHCGTWVYHAARLPQVQRIFHVGGEVDFDNGFRRLAPWKLLASGKITVFPAFRTFSRGRWALVPNQPVRDAPDRAVDPQRLETLLEPFRADLARHPLYISLDKDVMHVRESVVNWDSGCLMLAEVCAILKAFLNAANRNLLAMDLLGDWSPVRLKGLLRRFLHWTEHPLLEPNPDAAQLCNQRTNVTLLEALQLYVRQAIRPAQERATGRVG